MSTDSLTAPFVEGARREREITRRSASVVRLRRSEAEYALKSNWSVRADCRYADFGSTTDYPFAALPGGAVAHHTTENIVRSDVATVRPAVRALIPLPT